jgi:uncharacterized protein YcsI (UPF0317 family)
MRPMTPAQAKVALEVTSAATSVHGAPVQIGEAKTLGIADLGRPDFGDAVPMGPDEVPVFWACGVTPMEAIGRARPKQAVTHEPGHMFVTDLPEAEMLAGTRL